MGSNAGILVQQIIYLPLWSPTERELQPTHHLTELMDNLFCFFSFEPRAFYSIIYVEAVPSYYCREVLDTENWLPFLLIITSIQPFPFYFLNMHNALN